MIKLFINTFYEHKHSMDDIINYRFEELKNPLIIPLSNINVTKNVLLYYYTK